MISRLPPMIANRDHHSARIAVMYRGSVFALKQWLRWFPDDCAHAELTARIAELQCWPPMASHVGRPCSQGWYERQEMSWHERLRREAAGRAERGELGQLQRRQA